MHDEVPHGEPRSGPRRAERPLDLLGHVADVGQARSECVQRVPIGRFRKHVRRTTCAAQNFTFVDRSHPAAETAPAAPAGSCDVYANWTWAKLNATLSEGASSLLDCWNEVTRTSVNLIFRYSSAPAPALRTLRLASLMCLPLARARKSFRRGLAPAHLEREVREASDGLPPLLLPARPPQQDRDAPAERRQFDLALVLGVSALALADAIELEEELGHHVHLDHMPACATASHYTPRVAPDSIISAASPVRYTEPSRYVRETLLRPSATTGYRVAQGHRQGDPADLRH